MFKIKMALVSITIAVSLSIVAYYKSLSSTEVVPEKIVSTIVIVNDSSGVVVYSDLEKFLILTSKHVVIDTPKPKVSFVYFHKDKALKIEELISTSVEICNDRDIAIVEAPINKRLPFSLISKYDPTLGDDLWIAANPNRNYRSLKRGILSSKNRVMKIKEQFNNIWEVSGGVIFGSSGGGIFNTQGDLVGIVSGVDYYVSKQCYNVFDNNSKHAEVQCIRMTIPYIGYVEPLPQIKDFLIKSSFGNYFTYLVE